MNLMKQWARMVNENTYNFPEENPDEISNEKGTIEGDKYEDLIKDIEKANKKYEQMKKGTVSEAEGDEELPDTTEDYPEETPELRKMMDDIDSLVNSFSKSDPSEDPEYVRIHNRMSELYKDGLDKEENESEYKSLLSQLKKFMGGDSKKDDEGNKKYYVTGRIYLAHPQDTKSDVKKQFNKSAKDFDEYSDNLNQNLKGTKVERDDHFIKEFPDEKSAAKFVYDSIGELKGQYDIDYAKLKRLEDKDKLKINGKEIEVNAIPQTIKKVDPNAFGFEYDSTKGKDRVYDPGPKKDKNGEDLGSYNKIDEIFFVEFIVYKAEHPIPYDGGYDTFFEAWAEENVEGYAETKKEKQEEAKRKYEQEREKINSSIAEFEENQIQEYVNTITKNLAKMTTNGEEDEVDKILSPIFPEMTKEQRVNDIGPDDLEKLSRGKLWRIVKRIDGYLKKKSAEELKKSAEEFAKNGSSEKLATDDEILAAAEQENNGSIDGYSTRGDATQSDKEDEEDKKKEEEEREEEEEKDKTADKIENDSDDYESEQDAGGNANSSFSQIRNMKDYKKDSTSSQTLWGVPISSKELKYMQERIPRSEWAKNADQAKALIKRIRKEMNG